MKRPDSKAQAKRLLVHYLQTVWKKAGLKWDGDNEVETEEIVDSIIDAAQADVQELRDDISARLSSIETVLARRAQ